ncbi:Tex family protein [Lentilactobacillus kosonis]|uniref:Transcription accessory protein n=1 Tax=Lentilactobacillus kosonis TaxID=2810561 RepID=A0A401FJM0_9LACO|nr:Tex family protein [Lentilactobacillus kosonis]GAY72590.1 transcription accessory protein [Lentilactobacillus kosonis]
MTKLTEQLVAKLSGISKSQVKATLTMLSEGDTVPFIARYRKERTHNLDEVQIRDIQDMAKKIETLDKRKSDVIKKISEQEQLTPKLEAKINQSETVQQVDDLYLPFKQKRRTKATVAKERGLMPLAEAVLKFDQNIQTKINEAIDVDKELPTADDVKAGIHEILAEQIGEHPEFRTWIRTQTVKSGILTAKVKNKVKDTEDAQTYQQYFDFEEPIKSVPEFRVLAINRGEREGILSVKIAVNESEIFNYLQFKLIGNQIGMSAEIIDAAAQDAYKRFIGPAIEREIRAELTEKADRHAIDVFGKNLYNLLMQAPLKGRIVMGFDPAYRTGCKLAVVDGNGKFLGKTVIYPHKPASEAKRKAAKFEFIDFINQYHVEMIAIGNGTASRESEQFVADAIKEINYSIFYVIVNEAGASVYSASDVARREFPDFSVEQRSAVSIGRRIQDPLAELVKIDPQAIGVGQYQHDVSQKQLTEKLDQVVETAVNRVGINLNTASPELLVHISGLSKTIASNIVTYRNENGSFISRKQLTKVPRLGPKAYEQSVGFLRIVNGKNPFDNTDIHPESYAAANKLLKLYNIDNAELGSTAIQDKLSQVDTSELAKQLEIGEATLQDIIKGITSPGRDLRDDMPTPLLKQDVLKISDLKPGMKLQGTVRNVVDFGAFVDIGVKQDGLVHISKLSDHFVKDPSTVVAVGDVVNVYVESIDEQRSRIQLSMIEPNSAEKE